MAGPEDDARGAVAQASVLEKDLKDLERLLKADQAAVAAANGGAAGGVGENKAVAEDRAQEADGGVLQPVEWYASIPRWTHKLLAHLHEPPARLPAPGFTANHPA